MSLLLQQTLNAVLLGASYSLVAIGYSLFFGVMDIVIFCAGDVGIFGAYMVMVVATVLGALAAAAGAGLPWPLAVGVVLVAACLTGLLMVGMYKVTVAPFEGKDAMVPLLTTIAGGVILREAIGLFYPQGRNPQVFPQLLPTGFLGGNPLLSWRNLIIIGVTVAIVAFLYWFINRTKLGLSIQAASQNREAAIMVGINWRRVVLATFMLGGFILGIGGFLVGSYYNMVRYDMGSMYGLKGFSAAVVGGLGNVYGAIVGGLVLAFVEVFVSAFIPGGTAYASIAAFLIVILFMLFKPEGIIGERTVEKV